MKANTKKSRKITHKFIDTSRVSKVVVMPKYHTRAYADRFKYRLLVIFEVDYEARYPEYIKSLNNALHEASLKEMEINGVIAKDLGADIIDYTWILEKVNRSSKRIDLI